VQLAIAFAKEEGLHIIIVCDGATRHDSKRASIERQSKREKARINALVHRAEMMAKQAEINVVGTPVVRKLELREEEVNNIIAISFVSVGQEFYEELKEAVTQISHQDSVGKDSKIEVAQAVFQADAVIARACLEKKCDLAFMTDTDLAVYAGKECVSVKEYNLKKLHKNQYTIATASIFSASMDTVKALCSDLLKFDPTPCTIKEAKLANTTNPSILADS
jgi:hypothetical protein